MLRLKEGSDRASEPSTTRTPPAPGPGEGRRSACMSKPGWIVPLRKADAMLGHGEAFKVATVNAKSTMKATMHLQIR